MTRDYFSGKRMNYQKSDVSRSLEGKQKAMNCSEC